MLKIGRHSLGRPALPSLVAFIEFFYIKAAKKDAPLVVYLPTITVGDSAEGEGSGGQSTFQSGSLAWSVFFLLMFLNKNPGDFSLGTR